MRLTSSGLLLGGLATLLLASGPFSAAQADGEETILKDDAGNPIVRYVVEPPAGVAPAGTKDPARQVGLILCFPEHGHPTGEEIVTVRDSLQRLQVRDGYVLLAAHAQSELGKFGDADEVPLEKLIEWAKKTYPINPRRIYMFGRGEGAKITGEFGTQHPNIITSGIMYSWGFWKFPAEIKDPLGTQPEFYLNLGLKDLATHLVRVRETYSAVKAHGYHTIYREFPDQGAKTYFPVGNDDALAWAIRMRNKNVVPSAEEVSLLQHARTVRAPGAKEFAALELVGGAPAGAVIQRYFTAKDPTVRAAAAASCGRALYGEPTEAALATLLSDPSPQVRQAALASLGLAADWRSAAAQSALIRLATSTDPKVLPADRLAAVDTLGQAMKLQVPGVRQDPPVFKALVQLLDSPDAELRSHSFAILAPARPSDYRPDAAPEARKAALAGWQAWLEEITAKEDAYGKPM